MGATDRLYCHDDDRDDDVKLISVLQKLVVVVVVSEVVLEVAMGATGCCNFYTAVCFLRHPQYDLMCILCYYTMYI